MAKHTDNPAIAEFVPRDSQGIPEAASRFLTVAEVAEIMRVSKMTVYRMVHSGELPAVRFGRSFRVHSEQVHKFLEVSYHSAS